MANFWGEIKFCFKYHMGQKELFVLKIANIFSKLLPYDLNLHTYELGVLITLQAGTDLGEGRRCGGHPHFLINDCVFYKVFSKHFASQAETNKLMLRNKILIYIQYIQNMAINLLI